MTSASVGRFCSLRSWAAETGLGYTTARAARRRALDPLPARQLFGRRWLIDRAEAARWLERQVAAREIDLDRLIDEIVRALERGT